MVGYYGYFYEITFPVTQCALYNSDCLGFQCSEQPRKLGCFQDSIKIRLMSTYGFSVKMKNADWLGDKWNEHLDKLLCK